MDGGDPREEFEMGGLSIWHWLVVGVLIMLLFGRGKFSGMMGDVAKGIKEFKKGMAEEDEPAAPAPQIEPPVQVVADADKQSDKTV
jgi:sec-independent protein translocase protein TatA